MASLVCRSVSETTWSFYSRVWEEWFVLVRGVGGVVSEDDIWLLVLYFIGRNVENRLSVSSLNRKLADLALLFKLLGLCNHTKDFLVRQAIRGYRRGCRPVFYDLLGSLVRVLPSISFFCV